MSLAGVELQRLFDEKVEGPPVTQYSSPSDDVIDTQYGDDDDVDQQRTQSLASSVSQNS